MTEPTILQLLQQEDLTPETLIIEFNKGRVPMEFWIGFKNVLVNRWMDPTVILLKIFDYPVDINHMLLIGFCLRYGGNPNAYVAVRKLGKNLHILPLIYTKMMRNNSSKMIDMVVLMFMMSADVMTKLAEDPYAGQIRDQYRSVKNSQTVRQWLVERKYNVVTSYQQNGLEQVVPSETLTVVRILLDRCQRQKLDPMFNSRIIKSLGEDCAHRLTVSNRKILWNDADLLLSIQHLNLGTFKHLLHNGKLPTYPLMNEMILQAKLYFDDQVDFALNVMYSMIIESVKSGYRIDIDQNALISSIGDDEFFDKVQEAFEHPSWKKMCACQNDSDDVPLRLRELGIAMGMLNASKTQICTAAASTAAQADKTQVVAEFRKRNVLHPKCNNRAMLPYDQDNYSELEIVHYADQRGSKWCFTSDMYEVLLDKRVNIFTLEPLTGDVIFELQSKYNILRDMGMSLKPKSLDERLAVLWDNDVIEDNYQQVEQVQLILGEHGVSAQQYQYITEEVVEQFLRRHGIRSNLTKLPRRHFKITLVWMIKWIYNNDHEIYEGLLKIFNDR